MDLSPFHVPLRSMAELRACRSEASFLQEVEEIAKMGKKRKRTQKQRRFNVHDLGKLGLSSSNTQQTAELELSRDKQKKKREPRREETNTSPQQSLHQSTLSLGDSDEHHQRQQPQQQHVSPLQFCACGTRQTSRGLALGCIWYVFFVLLPCVVTIVVVF